MNLEVKIILKKGVSDPEGAQTKKALNLLGFKNVQNVSTIKVFKIDLAEKDRKKAIKEVQEMCKKLLANPVIHDYSIDIFED